MSLNEVKVWIAWRKKFGPMNDVRRYDRPAALIGSILSAAHGGKTKMADLMPFGKDERPPTLEEIVSAFGGVNVVKRR